MRVFIAVATWLLVSALAWWLGAKNYIVLGQGASIVAFTRAHPNWKLGLVLFLVGLPFAASGFFNSLFWPSHSLKDVLLLDPSIGLIFGGALATGYACFFCGTLSVIWGCAVGYPPRNLSQSAP